MSATTATGRRTVCSAGHRPRPPTEAQTLRAEIRAVCAEVDRRLGNRPGTCERGTYFWYWPGTGDVAVLAALHADAVALLDSITPSTEGKP